MLGQVCDRTMCVHPVIPPARKPLETAVQTTSGCCQCPVSRSLLPSGPVLFLPTLSPLSAPLACRHRLLWAWGWCYQGSRLQAAWAPLTHLLRGAQPARCLMLEKAAGPGGPCNLLMEGTLAFSGWPAASPRVIHLLSGVWRTKSSL